MTKIEYKVWDYNPLAPKRKFYASFETIKNVADSWQLAEGISRAKDFPNDAIFQIDRSHPNHKLLADTVPTRGGAGFPVISTKLQEIIKSFDPKQTEYLPITLADSKGEVLSTKYVILNNYLTPDVLDTDRMEIIWNSLDPDWIMSCRGVVLKDKILNNPALFRPRHMQKRLFVRQDLVEAIQAAGCTGIRFISPSEIHS